VTFYFVTFYISALEILLLTYLLTYLLVAVVAQRSPKMGLEADTNPTDDTGRVRNRVSGRVCVSNVASE